MICDMCSHAKVCMYKNDCTQYENYWECVYKSWSRSTTTAIPVDLVFRCKEFDKREETTKERRLRHE